MNSTSGTLTLVGGGDCEITATATGTANYNEAVATYRVIVQTTSTGISLVVSDENIDEDEGNTRIKVTAALNSAPRNSDTSVSVMVGDSNDVAVEGSDYARVNDLTVTIPAGETSGVATFSLTPSDDDLDEVDETLSVAGTTSTGLTVTGTTITIADNDQRGVKVTPVLLDVSEGGSSSYSVVLTSEPTGDVMITPAVNGSDDVTLNASSLTFTSSNWDTAQTIMVSGTQDIDAVNDTASVEHTVSRADYGDNGVEASEVAVTVTDDDTASTVLILTLSDKEIDEDAGATMLTLNGTLDEGSLTTDTVVRVSVGASDDAAVKGTDYTVVNDLTFTISAGQTTAMETFSFTPEDDDVDEVDETLTVSGTTGETDLTVTGTTITITDDDVRGVEVSATSLTLSEGGSSTYSVKLTSAPTGPVTVTPRGNGSSDVTLDVSSLTFNSSNWNTTRTVTVSAAQDSDDLNDTASIEHAVSGADYSDNNVTADDVAVTVGDDERASTGMTLSVSPREIDEGAGATIVTVTGTLGNAPLTTDTSVTVSVLASSDAIVEGTDYITVNDLTIMIVAGDAMGTASFTLTPLDDRVDEDDEALTVGGTAEGLEVTAGTITITDDDTRGVLVSSARLSVTEGGFTSYQVVLESQPTNSVTVTPRVQGDSDLTLNPESLSFTTQNWATAQMVTVSASGDADAKHDEARIEHVVSGGDYGPETADGILVRIRDNFLNNNVPVFPAVSQSMLEVAENTVADTAIGAPFEATDVDGQTLGYALEGVDGNSFSIDPANGQLKTREALDYESRVGYSLRVTVDDGHGGKAGIDVMLSVTDTDEQADTPEAPVVLAATGTTTRLRVRWSAPERGGGPPITDYDLQYREGATGIWINRSHRGTDTRATIAGLEPTTEYQVRVRALNGEARGEWSEPGSGNTGRADNSTPVFDSELTTELSVDENTTAGTDLGTAFAATDSDGDSLTYLLDGTDRNAFAIDPQSGQLSTHAALNHESDASYLLLVRADDGNGGNDSLSVTVSVLDIDEQAATPSAPLVLASRGSTTSLKVNWSAPDTNSGPAITSYAVQYRKSEEGAWIDHRHAGTGTGTVIDYLDTAKPYHVRVRSLNGEIPGEWSEPGTGSTGDPANAPPLFDSELQTDLRVRENIAEDIEIGVPFVATDSDGDILTYLLEGASRFLFSIDPNSGQLRTLAVLDHESRASHSLRVHVNDGKGGSDAVSVRVRVLDLDESAPPLSAPGVLATPDSTTSLDLNWMHRPVMADRPSPATKCSTGRGLRVIGLTMCTRAQSRARALRIFRRQRTTRRAFGR